MFCVQFFFILLIISMENFEGERCDSTGERYDADFILAARLWPKYIRNPNLNHSIDRLWAIHVDVSNIHANTASIISWIAFIRIVVKIDPALQMERRIDKFVHRTSGCLIKCPSHPNVCVWRKWVARVYANLVESNSINWNITDSIFGEFNLWKAAGHN